MKCDEETELEMALSEIIEKEQAADLERKENTNTLTKKNENDKASAEESRLEALERLGRTKKRNADSGDEVIKPKSRRSTTEAVQIHAGAKPPLKSVIRGARCVIGKNQHGATIRRKPTFSGN